MTNTSKLYVTANIVAGKLCAFVGYIIVFLFSLPLFTVGYEGGAGTYIVVFLFIAAGLALIVYSSRTKKTIKRFRHYVAIISSEDISTIESIAEATSQSQDFVQKDLQKMIDRRLFINTGINLKSGEIVFNNTNKIISDTTSEENIKSETNDVQCRGCGATTTKIKGSASVCDYCGLPLE